MSRRLTFKALYKCTGCIKEDPPEFQWNSSVSFSALPQRHFVCDSSGISGCFIDNEYAADFVKLWHQNDINILAQLPAYKLDFKPTILVRDLNRAQFVVYAGEPDLGLQFKGHVLLLRFLAFRKAQWMRSIDWSALWHRNNICELLKWVAFTFKDANSTWGATAFIWQHWLLSWLHDCLHCLLFIDLYIQLLNYLVYLTYKKDGIKSHNYKNVNWNDTIKFNLLLRILISAPVSSPPTI